MESSQPELRDKMPKISPSPIMVSNDAASSLDLEKMAAAAKKKIESLESKSQLFSKAQFDVIPKFALDEVTLGRILGKGKFGTV